MTDAVKVFLLTISALFPIVDPLAGSPMFWPLLSSIPLKSEGGLRGELQ